jgi:methyl-accepting chemotaxis protein
MNPSRSRPIRTDALGRPAQNQETIRATTHLSRPSSRRGYARNLFLDLPIAGRLTLGFLVAALVAALAAGIVGIQRAQSLSRQTDFYHTLLQLNTSLTSGRSFLELMNSKLHQTLDDASSPHPSQETLNADLAALKNLARLYAQTLNAYAQHDLLDQHPDQLALLDEAGDESLATQQRTLTSSAQRTWQFSQDAQQQILTSLSSGDVKGALLELQQQGEPTNADALSALHALIQLNDRLASAVDDATNVEIHNQLITTLLATLCAFLAIALVGWFISETLVRRLRHLHRVTRAVEEGNVNERVQVVGRDEIAEVSVAVNAMVDTIVGLLEETRQQRDALTGAAEHLFSDMRIVNAGDLRVSATVSNDPIGMLADAFNFTVGRFRRFILRTRTTIEQLDVISRQGLERSNAFLSLVRSQLREVPTPRSPSASAAPSAQQAQSASTPGPLRPGLRRQVLQSSTEKQKEAPVREVQDDLNRHLSTARDTIEKASLSIGRLSELVSTRSGSYSGNVTEKMVQAQLQELRSLEHLLNRLAWEVRQTQLNATNHLTKIEAAFASLVRSAGEHSAASTPESSEDVVHAYEEQYQEFVRKAGSFGIEINALSRRLAATIKEMRTSITPFRLEGGDAESEFARFASSQQFAEQPSPPPSSGNLTSTW